MRHLLQTAALQEKGKKSYVEAVRHDNTLTCANATDFQRFIVNY